MPYLPREYKQEFYFLNTANVVLDIILVKTQSLSLEWREKNMNWTIPSLRIDKKNRGLPIQLAKPRSTVSSPVCANRVFTTQKPTIRSCASKFSERIVLGRRQQVHSISNATPVEKRMN